MHTVSLFHNDAVLPVQFHEYAAARSGYHRLLLGILEEALNALRQYDREVRSHPRLIHSRRMLAEIRAWFASEEVIYGSFLYICQHLDLDAPGLRRQLASGSLHTMPRRILAHSGGPHRVTTTAYYQKRRGEQLWRP